MERSKTSLLLSLPPEMRLMIYDAVFESTLLQFRLSNKIKDLEPTILFQVCSLIRNEASPRFDLYIRNVKSVEQQAKSIEQSDESDDEDDEENTMQEKLQAIRKYLSLCHARLHSINCTINVRLRSAARVGKLGSELEELKASVKGIRTALVEVEKDWNDVLEMLGIVEGR